MFRLIVLICLILSPAYAAGKKAKDKPESSIDCTHKKPGNPICYAREIESMLAEHTKKLTDEVKQRRKDYDVTATQFDRDVRGQIQSDLAAERSRRADQLARRLRSSQAQAFEWKFALHDYMVLDMDRMSSLLLADLEHGAAAGFVASIEDLRNDVEKAQKLADLVHLLATPRNLKDELEQWLSYGKETKDEYLQLSCAKVLADKGSANAQLTTKTAELAAAKAMTPPDLKKIEDISKAVSGLTDRVKHYGEYMTAKKCPAN